MREMDLERMKAHKNESRWSNASNTHCHHKPSTPGPMLRRLEPTLAEPRSASSSALQVRRNRWSSLLVAALGPAAAAPPAPPVLPALFAPAAPPETMLNEPGVAVLDEPPLAFAKKLVI